MKITDKHKCDVWYQALLERSAEHTGVFFVGVRTTGVFCISICRARKPKRENVEFYDDFKSALDAGYRPCKICRPTENSCSAPAFIEQALKLVSLNPKARISDGELRKQGLRKSNRFLKNCPLNPKGKKDRFVPEAGGLSSKDIFRSRTGRICQINLSNGIYLLSSFAKLACSLFSTSLMPLLTIRSSRITVPRVR